MMKIDKRTIIFIGIVAISVVFAVLTITIYYGMRSGGSITEVISIIFLETQTGFFVASSILIAVFCLKLSSAKIVKEFFATALITSASMLVINLLLFSKNFMAGPVFLFWALTLLYLYQTKRELKKIEKPFNKLIEADRE